MMEKVKACTKDVKPFSSSWSRTRARSIRSTSGHLYGRETLFPGKTKAKKPTFTFCVRSGALVDDKHWKCLGTRGKCKSVSPLSDRVSRVPLYRIVQVDLDSRRIQTLNRFEEEFVGFLLIGGTYVSQLRSSLVGDVNFGATVLKFLI